MRRAVRKRAAAPQAIAVTRAVATTFYRLLAVKDEYEVARLHTDQRIPRSARSAIRRRGGQGFRRQVQSRAADFVEGRSMAASRCKKTFGQWMWPVLGTMAKFRGLRGTMLDPFGTHARTPDGT